MLQSLGTGDINGIVDLTNIVRQIILRFEPPDGRPLVAEVKFLIHRDGSVTGIDVAPDMIAVAKAIPSGGAPITWQEADAASLPLPDEFYDLGEDPFEKNNLADRIATEELESRREDLLAWRSRSAATAARRRRRWATSSTCACGQQKPTATACPAWELRVRLSNRGSPMWFTPGTETGKQSFTWTDRRRAIAMSAAGGTGIRMPRR